jgi:hypothetical protein
VASKPSSVLRGSKGSHATAKSKASCGSNDAQARATQVLAHRSQFAFTAKAFRRAISQLLAGQPQFKVFINLSQFTSGQQDQILLVAAGAQSTQWTVMHQSSKISRAPAQRDTSPQVKGQLGTCWATWKGSKPSAKTPIGRRTTGLLARCLKQTLLDASTSCDVGGVASESQMSYWRGYLRHKCHVGRAVIGPGSQCRTFSPM